MPGTQSVNMRFILNADVTILLPINRDDLNNNMATGKLSKRSPILSTDQVYSY